MCIFSKKTFIFPFIGFVLSLLFSGLLAGFAYAAPPSVAVMHITRDGKNVADFQVEIAESTEDKIHGLMFRESMPNNHGMVFPYSPPTDAHMWMKNTLIPLDMLFVASGHIVHIHHNATPHSLTPIGAGQPVSAVIEINGGAAKAQDIQVDDQIIIEQAAGQGTAP